MEEKTMDLIRLCHEALTEKKASDITVIDISGLSVVADCFIIASGENVRQTAALCENVEEKLGRAGFTLRSVEGKQTGNWILLDYGDVIVHIFDKENRLFYDIERIWKDGKKIIDISSL